MNATPFIFGGDTGLSYDEIQRMQAIAQGLREPQKISTAGEGIRSAAQSLAGGMIANKARKAEAAGRDDFTQQLTAALRGGYGDASGYSTMGGFTPQPAPKPISAGPGGTSEGLTPQAQDEWAKMMTPQARLSTSARVKEPENWEQIQNGIFAGESGGDYDALFGFRNRQPGAPQVSKMTVGQVMEFTDPRGPYAQSVKDEIGRVATPVGAYQIVGTTLRGAVEELGIDPNTPFDKETQDLLGKHILATQGTGAWEGYKGPRDSYTPAGGSFAGGDYQTAQASLPDLDPQTLRLIELSNSEWATPGQRAMLGAMIDRRQKRAALDYERQQAAAAAEQERASAGRWEPAGQTQSGATILRHTVTGDMKTVGDGGSTAKSYQPMTPEQYQQWGLDPKTDGPYAIGSDGLPKALRSEPLVEIGGSARPMTTGDEALDRAYAKEYDEWTSVGEADYLANRSRLDEAIGLLEGGANITGPGFRFMPDFVQSWLNPDALNTRESVEEVVQRNLRAVLGAQFTQKEGDRLIQRAYNQNLPEEANLRRLKRLVQMMDIAAEQKQSKAQYFRENGTLRGWESKPVSISDFEAELDAMDAEDGVKSAPEDDRKPDYRFNPETGELEAVE